MAAIAAVAVPENVDRGKPTFAPTQPVVFVVPAFNEADNLPRLFADLEVRPTLFPSGSRLIIVDDGSPTPPRTRGALRRPAAGQCLRMGRTGTGRGVPRRLRGVLAGTTRGVTRRHAGSRHDQRPRDAADDAEPGPRPGTTSYSLRFTEEAAWSNVSPLRRILRAARDRVRRALRVDARTVSSFFRVYRASTLRRGFEHYGDDLLSKRGFACKAEILANLVALGASIAEVPTDLDGSRRVGASKMRILPTMRPTGASPRPACREGVVEP